MMYICGVTDRFTGKMCGEKFPTLEALRFHNRNHPKHAKQRKSPSKPHRPVPCEETVLRPDFKRGNL